MEAITQLIMALFIYYLVFIAIGQPEMFYFSSASTKSKSSEEKELNNEIAFEQLTKLMKEKHPYLDPNLRVHNLAAMLNVTPHVVSKAINMKASVNFYDFVNTYRIEEFKKRVTSKGYEHLTLLGIAYDVGFNSKTSFNRIFKNHTGLTPSEYIKIK